MRTKMVSEASQMGLSVPALADAVPTELWLDALEAEALAHPASNHRLLRRIAAGDFADMPEVLRTIALQYGQYSRHFISYVEGVIAQLSNPRHADALRHNLEEELGLLPDGSQGKPHREIYQDYLHAIGVDADYSRSQPPIAEGPSWATAFRSLCADQGAAAGIGALGLGTELIVAQIYGFFLTALERHTSLTEEDRLFFSLHAVCDVEHSATLRGIAHDLVESEPAARSEVERGMRAALALRAEFWTALEGHLDQRLGAKAA